MPTQPSAAQPAFRADAFHLAILTLVLIAASFAVDFIANTTEQSMVFVQLGVVLFWGFVIASYIERKRIGRVFAAIEERAVGAGDVIRRGGLLDLFLISFVVLFVEIMLIRYIGSQTRIFAFYKNIPLVGAFLGLGLGCFQGKGGRREAFRFLAAMPILALFFAVAAQALGTVLGASASLATSERIFGYGFFTNIPWVIKLLANLQIGVYCVAVFIAVAWLFSQLGRLLGAHFDDVPRLKAYTVNVAGSLAGLAVFVVLSRLHTAPWLWFLVGLLPLLRWLGSGRALRAGAALAVLSAAIVFPHLHETVWSSYQKLTGKPVENGYQIDISDAFYQVAADLRPETLAKAGPTNLVTYAAEFTGIPNPGHVLVVGAGSGNDVAAALRAGATQVDAVDIDGAIVEMGRQHHPERPYDNPKVRVIIDDARHAFRTLPAQSYDTVIFGLLDSHTQLGASSVRLDNYVFTQESFSAAARLIRPGGHVVLSILTAVDWMRDRFGAMLERACGSPVTQQALGPFTVYTCSPGAADPAPGASGAALNAPIDDWPFPYLPERGIPLSYGVVIGMLAVASIVWLRRNGMGAVDVTPANLHMFFLGSAFLLMEVYAINRLALLFGTTWLVSAVSIAAMLVEIVIANLVVSVIRLDLRPLAYLALAGLLVAGWLVGPEVVLDQGTGMALLYALFLLSPVLCAGIVFATSFRGTPHAGTALGANILGAVLGGWAEYATMATGIRAMALVALALYAASALALILAVRQRRLAAQ
jgi:SAM-dependent methyltransferase/general stress protein CsbA